MCSRRVSCWVCPRRRGRGTGAEDRARRTSEQGLCGRRPPSWMPTRRSAWRVTGDLRRRLDPGRGDRRGRCLERGRLCRGGRGGGRGHPRGAGIRGFARRSMRLCDVGELGLLAELERRGLAEHRARRGRARRRACRHAGRACRGGPFPARLALLARARVPRGSGQPERPLRVGAQPAASSSRSARPPETPVEDVLELYGGIAETGVPVVAETRPARTCSRCVTALGRSERVPGRAGARPGDPLVVTGPLGGAGAAFREERYVRPPLRLAEGRGLAAATRDARPLRRPRGRRRSHRAPLRLRAARSTSNGSRCGGRSRRPRLRRGLRAARRHCQ